VKVSKYVELDFDEIICKKSMTIGTKQALRTVLEQDNPAEFNARTGTIMSPEYCLLSADLRSLDEERAAVQNAVH
jgi:hypothetical protein